MDGEKIILARDAEDAQKKMEHLIKARNKACFLIEDAKARYVKEKTRARSKKAAMERDALASSPRFAVLNDYNRREDIQEAYGCDCFGEAERDRLEALWDEREEIRNSVVDGYYKDDVTDALHQAYLAISDLWEEQIEEAEIIQKEFKKQRQQAEEEAAEWTRRQNEEYEKLTGGKGNGE